MIDALNGGADRYVEKSGNPAERFGALAGTIEQLVSHERESVTLQSRTEGLEFLSRSAWTSSGWRTTRTIYRYIGEQIHSLIPDCYIILLSLDSDTRLLPVRQRFRRS